MAENAIQKAPQTGIQALNKILNTEAMQKKFADMLGKKSVGFLSSISNIVTNNDLLQKADINSIVLAAAQAAALDLPINPNLGYAAIVPFNDTKNRRCLAQFQIMRDGWVELALRTGQVVALVNEPVYEGELVSRNRFRDEYVFDEAQRKSNKVVGYMAYIKLTNGFEKTVYITADEAKAHALKYSKTFKKGYGLWKDDFESMALKTVLKRLIKKYCPKSIEMQRAIVADNASFKGDVDNFDNAQPVYADNQEVIDVPVHEVQEINPDEIPVAEVKEAPKPKVEPETDDF